jgi:hypothetical protein
MLRISEFLSSDYLQFQITSGCPRRILAGHQDNSTGGMARQLIRPCGSLENQMKQALANRLASYFTLEIRHCATMDAQNPMFSDCVRCHHYCLRLVCKNAWSLNTHLQNPQNYFCERFSSQVFYVCVCVSSSQVLSNRLTYRGCITKLRFFHQKTCRFFRSTVFFKNLHFALDKMLEIFVSI